MESVERLRALRLAVREAVPDRPGVYTWLGQGGEKLYIGKSRALKTRMLSYLHPGNLRPDARLRHLAQAITAFEWKETQGELLALLLEDALIKKLNPRHNERQKDYRERAYVLLTDDLFPALLVAGGESRRAGTLYGPFKDEYFARELVQLLTDALALRACTDAEPWRRSARYDLGQCPGPCRGAITAEDYALRVRAARAFFDGDAGPLRRRLEAKMADASDHLRFEEAAALRDALEFAGRFAERQRFFREFESAWFSVQEERAGVVYTFTHGSLSRLQRCGEPVAPPPELRERVEDRRFLLDRANVVYAWLGRTKGEAALSVPDAVRFRMA